MILEMDPCRDDQIDALGRKGEPYPSLPTVQARCTGYGRDSQMASALARSQGGDVSSDVLGISTDPADK